MRISAQNNQFVFNLPSDFIDSRLEEKYKLIFEKNFIPYDSIMDYINSTIKEIIIPSFQAESSEQILKRGKGVYWKDSKSIFDAFTRELDITFRAVDSFMNYFMLQEILIDFMLDTAKQYIPYFHLHILDKDGDVIFTINYKEVLLKSISEQRLSYNVTDFSEKTFTITFTYNFIDIIYKLDDETPTKDQSVFDVPTKDVNDRKV